MIEVSHLTVRYGTHAAVNDVSFSVSAGDIYGFIGANGAGKTTTMRVMATLMLPSEGVVRIGGHDVVTEPDAVRRLIGYLPDFFGVYDNLRAWEYLDFFADAYHVPRAQRPAAFDRVLAQTRLEVKRNAFVDHLSRGMKQRLGLARALLHQPRLLILDEPASGLDPHARIELRDILCDLARAGVTIFVSSHILTELSDFCTKACMLEAGKAVAEGPLADIGTRAGLREHVLVEAPGLTLDALRTALGGMAAKVEQADGTRFRIQLAPGTDVRVHALRALVDADIPLSSFSVEKMSLEDIFMHLSKGELA